MKLHVTRLAVLLTTLATIGSAETVLGQTRTYRIVSYNIDCADQGNDNNITASYAGLPTVLQAIGQHHLGSNAQPIDVLGVEELNSTTLSNLVNKLNGIYGAGTYAFDPTTDPNSGGGPDGLIYNTHTIQVVSAAAIGTVGTYPNVPRAPMRYQLRPVGFGPSADFYMYVSHARAGSDDSVGTSRYNEAQEIRNNANSLPANAHILYSGDWNLFNGNNAGGSPNGSNAENAYLCLTGQTTSDGHNWSGTTQAYDPTSPTTTTTTWQNNDASGVSNYLYDDSTSSLGSRLDVQLVSGAMLNQPGLRLAPDTSDPFTNNYPSSKYHYAFEVFGNNGTTAEGARTNLVGTNGNTSLSDLTNAATVLNDMMQPYSGNSNQFVGSDHLPVVGDYNLVGVSALPAPGDFNRDALVTVADVAAMMAALADLSGYQTSQSLTGPQLQLIGDLDGDTNVTNADLEVLLIRLADAGAGSLSAVPEPAAWVLALFGAVYVSATTGLRRIPIFSISTSTLSPGCR